MKYRKTALIDAVQFVGGSDPRLFPEGVEVDAEGAYIQTLEGKLRVSVGDWIATGVRGEHWAIKPDVFAASYEPAESSIQPARPAGGKE